MRAELLMAQKVRNNQSTNSFEASSPGREVMREPPLYKLS